VETNSEVTYFARLVEALKLWFRQDAAIGGRAHRLYRAHPPTQADECEPLKAFDDDVAVPQQLPPSAARIRDSLLKNGSKEHLKADTPPPYCKWVLSSVATALILFGSFASGFIASLHLKNSPSNETRRLYLQHAGDAPPAVRSGVLTALRPLQDGYIRRDPKDLDSFMSRLFARNGDILILGTDAGEWVRG